MAGANKIRRDRFLKEHPLCCFCGGSTPTETEDHMPARGLFLKRKWPGGFSFPACQKCNSASSKDEAILAWLFRVRLSDYSAEEEFEFNRASYELRRRYSEIWADLQPHSRLQTRKLLRESGNSKDIYKSSDVISSIAVPEVFFAASNRYGEKLAKAFYYKYTNRIAKNEAYVKAWTYSNVAVLQESFPRELLAALNAEAEVKHGSVSLESQFSCRFAVVEGGEAFAYVAFFGESTAVVGVVFVDPLRLELSRLTRAALSLSEEASLAPPNEP